MFLNEWRGWCCWIVDVFLIAHDVVVVSVVPSKMQWLQKHIYHHYIISNRNWWVAKVYNGCDKSRISGGCSRGRGYRFSGVITGSIPSCFSRISHGPRPNGCRAHRNGLSEPRELRSDEHCNELIIDFFVSWVIEAKILIILREFLLSLSRRFLVPTTVELIEMSFLALAPLILRNWFVLQ